MTREDSIRRSLSTDGTDDLGETARNRTVWERIWQVRQAFPVGIVPRSSFQTTSSGSRIGLAPSLHCATLHPEHFFHQRSARVEPSA